MATNSHIMTNNSTIIFCPYLLVIFTASSLATAALSYSKIDLHFHESRGEVDGSKNLLHPTYSTKTRSRIDEAPLEGREMKIEDAVSTLAPSKEEEEAKMSMGEKKLSYKGRKDQVEKTKVYDEEGCFVACSDYGVGGPHHHPPKNN